MSQDLSRRIRTVQYNDQRFSSTEIDVLHTPALQRLYDLHQLGLADRIFIDASHSRLHHVVGVVEQADKIMRSIIGNLRKHPDEKLDFAKGPQGGITKAKLAEHAESKILAVRVMGMLHDLTHAPYGHTLEDEIELVVEKHDEPQRQADAFYRLIVQYFGWIERNEDSSAWGAESRVKPPLNEHAKKLEWYLDSPDLYEPPVDDEFIEFLCTRWAYLLRPRRPHSKSHRKIPYTKLITFIKDLNFGMRALTHLDIAHKEIESIKPNHLPLSEYPFEQLLKGLLTAAEVTITLQDEFLASRDVFLLDVIGNTICADLLDYARRDAANAGIRLDYDPQRIVDQMTVVSSVGPLPRKIKNSKDELIDFPFSDACLRTCVSLFSHKLRTEVPGELLSLLQVRYFVYERMLFHPTKCVAGATMGAALQLIGWKSLPRHWRFVGDQVFLYQVSESARLVRDLLSKQTTFDYSTELVNKLCDLIDKLPENGINLAAKQLLHDRLIRAQDVTAQLPIAGRLAGMQDLESVLQTPLEKIKVQVFDQKALRELSEDLKANQDPQCRKALEWLQERIPTVSSVLAEIKAGIRLIDRLGARRYLKITFRLLPNAVADGVHGVGAEKVAELFKKPLPRKIAEREIERRAGLPLGSIVMHCPPVKGPTKIAKILITNTDTTSKRTEPRVARLNEISEIDKQVFEKHQQAIGALEAMYASTWRFAVSVAPPHDASWEKVNKEIGLVLVELLMGRSGDGLANDSYTVKEIEELEAGILRAEALATGEDAAAASGDAAGSSEAELILKLGEILRKGPKEFQELPVQATSAEIDAAQRKWQRRIRDTAKPLLASKSKGSVRPEEDVVVMFRGLFGIDKAQIIHEERFKPILKRASLLESDKWGTLCAQLEKFRPSSPLSVNLMSRDQRESFYEQIESVLQEAEEG